MTQQEIQGDRGAGADDDEISLRPLFRRLWRYRRVMAASVSVILIVFLIGAIWVYLRQPTELRASLEFRLVFDGVDNDEYPNGLRFTRSDIIAAPVLQDVFTANDLERYVSYEDFKSAIFILESSPNLALLTMEYQGKLTASVSVVDRATLEEEFRQKRQALRVAQYTLNLVSPTFNRGQVPPTLLGKVLNDVLATWSDQAAEHKHVLEYQVDVVSASGLFEDLVQVDDYFIRLDLLRSKINRIQIHLAQLSELPGAGVIRVGDERVSLAEIKANLEDLVQFRLQPLLGEMRALAWAPDLEFLQIYIEGQDLQVSLAITQAASSVAVLQQALRTLAPEGSLILDGQEADNGTRGGPGAGVQPMITQLNDSFLDRIVAMSTRSMDVEYRREIVEQIIEAGQAKVRLEREAAYYGEMMRWVRQTSAASTAAAAGTDGLRTFQSRFDTLLSEVLRVLDRANQLYAEISVHNLSTRAGLYTTTGPLFITTQRMIAARTLALYGFMVLMLSLMLVPLCFLVYHYFRFELQRRAPAPAPLA